MIINGKNVEVSITSEKPPSINVYDPLKIKKYKYLHLITLKFKIPYFKEMCSSYINDELDNFISYCKKMVDIAKRW